MAVCQLMIVLDSSIIHQHAFAISAAVLAPGSTTTLVMLRGDRDRQLRHDTTTAPTAPTASAGERTPRPTPATATTQIGRPS